MSKTVAYCSLIVAFGVVIALTVSAPAILGDSNSFLKEFLDRGLLDVLGVILAITLASAGQLHLTLVQLEERNGQQGYWRMRAGIKQAAYFLIGLFVFAVFLVVAKPLLANEEWSESLFNGLGLFVLLWNVLLLISLTQGTFAIKAEAKRQTDGG